METVQSYKLQIDMILQKSKNLPELKMMDQYKIIIICLIYVWTLQYQVSQMPSAVGWNAKPCESRCAIIYVILTNLCSSSCICLPHLTNFEERQTKERYLLEVFSKLHIPDVVVTTFSLLLHHIQNAFYGNFFYPTCCEGRSNREDNLSLSCLFKPEVQEFRPETFR